MNVSSALYMISGCLVTLGLMLGLMPALIDYLHRIKFGQTERGEGLESHKKKNGTPTMGGLAFILVPTLVFSSSFLVHAVQTVGHEHGNHFAGVRRVRVDWFY